MHYLQENMKLIFNRDAVGWA